VVEGEQMDTVLLCVGLAQLSARRNGSLPHNLLTAGAYLLIELVMAVPGHEHPGARED
jgi:hypothetical protein